MKRLIDWQLWLSLLPNVLVIGGLVAVTYGVSLIYRPAALIFAGLSLIVIGCGIVAVLLRREEERR